MNSHEKYSYHILLIINRDIFWERFPYNLITIENNNVRYIKKQKTAE